MDRVEGGSFDFGLRCVKGFGNDNSCTKILSVYNSFTACRAIFRLLVGIVLVIDCSTILMLKK